VRWNNSFTKVSGRGLKTPVTISRRVRVYGAPPPRTVWLWDTLTVAAAWAVEAADFVHLLQDLPCQRHTGQTKVA